MSLVVKAAGAIEERGTVTVATQRLTFDAEQLAGTSCEPGPYVRLQVGDSGAGMDDEELERAFDPLRARRSRRSRRRRSSSRSSTRPCATTAGG